MLVDNFQKTTNYLILIQLLEIEKPFTISKLQKDYKKKKKFEEIQDF